MSVYLLAASPILIYAGVLARTERVVAAVLAVAIFNLDRRRRASAQSSRSR